MCEPVHASVPLAAAHTSHALVQPTGDLSHLLNHEAGTNHEDFGPAPGSPYILSLVEVFKAVTSIFIPAASMTSSQTISLRPTDTKPCNHRSSADAQASSGATAAVRSTFMAALLEHTDDLLDAATTAQASTAKPAVDLEAAASREGDYEYADYADVQRASTEPANLTEEQLRVQQDLVDFAMATIEVLPEEPCEHEAASSIDDAAGQAEALQLQRGFIEYAEASLKPQPLEDEYDDVLMPMSGAAGDADQQKQQTSEKDAGVDRDDAMDFDFSSGTPEPLGEYDDYLEGMTEDLREEQQQLEAAEQLGQAEGEQGSYGIYEGDEDDLITSSVWSTLINEAAATVKEQGQQQDSKGAASTPSTESITAPVMSVPQGDAITMRRQDRGRLAGLHREHEAITRRRSLQSAQFSSSAQEQLLLDIALAPHDKQLQQGSGSSASQAAALEALAQHAVQTFTRLELVDMDLLKAKQQQVEQDLKAALQRISGLRDVIRSTMQVRGGGMMQCSLTRASRWRFRLHAP
jgi:hypothetical protein